MDQQVVKLAEETLARHEALATELSDPNIYNDQRHYAEVAKEHARMRRGAEMSQELLEAVEAEKEARERVPQAADAAERGFYAAEARGGEEKIEGVSERGRAEAIDRHPNE